MKVTVLGLIVEYNPFHNGHIYHIQKAKELINPDYTIAVMSSSFVQRGEPAIMDKWTRSKIAVENGIDLVIELPFVYACQSADYFAKGAIDLLSAVGVTDLCFGSEEGHIETFISIASTIKNNNTEYNNLIKKYINQGLRYPDACNRALKDLIHKEIITPNDLLGLSYVKEIVFNDYPIKPHCIKRSNDYHSQSLESISSATALRKALGNHLNISDFIPKYNINVEELYTLDDFFPYLKHQLLVTSKDILKNYHLVDEGLENSLITKIQTVSSMEELIQSLSSKRYTRPRIQRMFIHILMQNTKKDIKRSTPVDYVRILAMNKNGQAYLRLIKEQCPYTLMTNYGHYKHSALDIELKATKLLSLLSHDDHFIKNEYSKIPYIKKED